MGVPVFFVSVVLYEKGWEDSKVKCCETRLEPVAAVSRPFILFYTFLLFFSDNLLLYITPYENWVENGTQYKDSELWVDKCVNKYYLADVVHWEVFNCLKSDCIRHCPSKSWEPHYKLSFNVELCLCRPEPIDYECAYEDVEEASYVKIYEGSEQSTPA